VAKYIFIVGGVLSGVGKGITAASIGAVLQAKKLKVSIMKCDPMLNCDAGTLCPAEHGEVFITHDGRESDLDLGHYERFLDIETNRFSTILSGGLLSELITAERNGRCGGRTVQLVPHFTNLIQDKIEQSQKSSNSDVHIVEIGGTVGDIESLPYIEAIREFARRVGRENCLYVSVLWVPWINTSKELKSKPAQNALRDLRGFGIVPDLVCARTERPAPREILNKIAAFASIDDEAVINLPDVSSVYEVPLNLTRAGALDILDRFAGGGKADLRAWETLTSQLTEKYERTVRVGIISKYDNRDIALSAIEALKTAALSCQSNLEVTWFDARSSQESDWSQVDGLFLQGATDAIELALAQDKPYLSVGNPLASDIQTGDNTIKLEKNSFLADIYSADEVIERARSSRCAEMSILEDPRFAVSGRSEDSAMFIEAKDKKFIIITATNPELRSRPMRPHPLYIEFIRSML